MTKIEDYAYAVASVRQKERELLSGETLLRLCEQKTKGAVEKLLKESGFISEGEDAWFSLSKKEERTFKFLKDVAPKPSLLDFMVVKNDYHNIKAYLKSLVIEGEADEFFIAPCVIDPKKIKIDEKSKGELCGFAKEAIEEVYPIMTKTLDGQIVDAILDRLSLKTMVDMAKKTQSKFCEEFASIFVATIDIKAALRAKRARLRADFLEMALSGCGAIDKINLIEVYKRGDEALKGYIKSAGFERAVNAFEISDAHFERYMDEVILKKVEEARLISFGIEPLVSFYYETAAQVKTVRMILSAIEAEDFDHIKERVS